LKDALGLRKQPSELVVVERVGEYGAQNLLVAQHN
jgi:hypothetical protein